MTLSGVIFGSCRNNRRKVIIEVVSQIGVSDDKGDKKGGISSWK